MTYRLYKGSKDPNVDETVVKGFTSSFLSNLRIGDTVGILEEDGTYTYCIVKSRTFYNDDKSGDCEIVAIPESD